MSHRQSSVDRNEHDIALTRSLDEGSTVFGYWGNPVLHLGYMDSRTASSPDPSLQLVVLRLRWSVMTGLSVRKVLVVTVGMVPAWVQVCSWEPVRGVLRNVREHR